MHDVHAGAALAEKELRSVLLSGRVVMLTCSAFGWQKMRARVLHQKTPAGFFEAGSKLCVPVLG
jgi:hypothetical protein